MNDVIFEVIGFNNKNPQSDDEKELCDIGFSRYRDTIVIEDFSIVMVTTRTGGGNRLDYKENIRDIRDHSLYIDDCDHPSDDTYAQWYFRIPESKCSTIRMMLPHDYICRGLNRECAAENKIWNKLNITSYIDTESDTDYSDKDDFKSRYGYWDSDPGKSETDDEMSDTDIIQMEDE
jgi:hypothetical protein